MRFSRVETVPFDDRNSLRGSASNHSGRKWATLGVDRSSADRRGRRCDPRLTNNIYIEIRSSVLYRLIDFTTHGPYSAPMAVGLAFHSMTPIEFALLDQFLRSCFAETSSGLFFSYADDGGIMTALSRSARCHTRTAELCRVN
jgi:hypothetical protein